MSIWVVSTLLFLLGMYQLTFDFVMWHWWHVYYVSPMFGGFLYLYIAGVVVILKTYNNGVTSSHFFLLRIFIMYEKLRTHPDCSQQFRLVL